MEVIEQPKNETTEKKLPAFKRALQAMFSKKSGKIVLLSGLLALLVVTGYLNFKLNSDAINVNANTEQQQTDLFVMFKDNRADARASRELILKDMIESSATTAEAKTTAQTELLALQKEIAFETKAESDILTQCGFANVVVSMSDSNINVLVKTQELLQQQQVNKICSILDVCNGDEVLNLFKVYISEIE
jgi:hypothetical protein